MRHREPSRRRVVRSATLGAGVLASSSLVVAAIIDLTMDDFHLRGTQIGDVAPERIFHSNTCANCHANFDEANEPMSTWSGSLMAQAGRDPLFFAQMATANQDVANAGNFCMRCHVPMSFVTGHAAQPDGSTLDAADLDGVSCHFCHSMVDPIYRAGSSPPGDESILQQLAGGPPQHYGNAMFVLDPTGTRRGPIRDPVSPHVSIYSPFHSSGNFCGTCHEVGNVAVSRRPDGSYRYNAVGQPTPDENTETMFPLERTYTEWRLSEFAASGVDMGGRFGGENGGTVSSCQDCHMPAANARACYYGPDRSVHRHEFAGASAQVIDIISLYTQDDGAVDQAALARGRAASVSMLQRAATLELSQTGADLNVRVINQTGHKLPTGHIEGRRVWIGVQFRDGSGNLVAEHGRYDQDQAALDEASTTVYEMHVGLSDDAARITGLPAGPTGHMALADTIEKDNRIPPRGFSNSAFLQAGAPAVGAAYSDGQYWDDRLFEVPPGAASATVSLWYQNTPRHYMEMLRDNNHSNSWGQLLYQLWAQTGRGAPIEMSRAEMSVTPACRADFNHDGRVDSQDFFDFITELFTSSPGADYNRDGFINSQDFFDFITDFFTGCP